MIKKMNVFEKVNNYKTLSSSQKNIFKILMRYYCKYVLAYLDLGKLNPLTFGWLHGSY